MQPPRIAITMGDPAGVGPEICLQLLQHAETSRQCAPVVFGDARVLEQVAWRCGLGELPRVIPRDQWQASWAGLAGPAIWDLPSIDPGDVEPGIVNAATGRAAFCYIEAAITAALAAEVDAVATGPIHKEAIHAAGVPFPGHTELFADRCSARRYCMMLTSDKITCSFVTAHVGYRDVPALLTAERVLEVIELSHDVMDRLRCRPPKLLVCGLNPHAGEHGLFGDSEEQRVIQPAVDAARAKGIHVEGPTPPDTAFLPDRRREFDCFVCMYHDQGHIPLKALAFDSAVNVTLGLPIIRTSVDHGTALDIAWRGKAAPTSLIEAVKLATRLASSRVAISS